MTVTISFSVRGDSPQCWRDCASSFRFAIEDHQAAPSKKIAHNLPNKHWTSLAESPHMNADNSSLHTLRPSHNLDILLHLGLHCHITRGGKKTTRNLAAHCTTGCDFQPEPARGQDGGDKQIMSPLVPKAKIRMPTCFSRCPIMSSVSSPSSVKYWSVIKKKRVEGQTDPCVAGKAETSVCRLPH
jgi:hypothetical protein